MNISIIMDSRIFLTPSESRIQAPQNPEKISHDLAYRTFREVPGLDGNLLQDAHTAIPMREHEFSGIYTRDMDFRRFTFLELNDPISTNT
ncbi:MAG: hypothetical protein HY693_00710 [Deltaproteobacteria bacterium]|nr:hypothetical protein [Deltaproteobacteria bacterium]